MVKLSSILLGGAAIGTGVLTYRLVVEPPVTHDGIGDDKPPEKIGRHYDNETEFKLKAITDFTAFAPPLQLTNKTWREFTIQKFCHEETAPTFLSVTTTNMYGNPVTFPKGNLQSDEIIEITTRGGLVGFMQADGKIHRAENKPIKLVNTKKATSMLRMYPLRNPGKNKSESGSLIMKLGFPKTIEKVVPVSVIGVGRTWLGKDVSVKDTCWKDMIVYD